jgi:hypothetical protein
MCHAHRRGPEAGRVTVPHCYRGSSQNSLVIASRFVATHESELGSEYPVASASSSRGGLGVEDKDEDTPRLNDLDPRPRIRYAFGSSVRGIARVTCHYPRWSLVDASPSEVRICPERYGSPADGLDLDDHS